jgi:hypothetical protein
MKLVTLYVDPGDAVEASTRLRQAGVMTKITMVDPHNIKPSKSGAQRVGLAVVFDDQFDDAVQLLENPDHTPKRIITSNEMHEIESSGRRSLFEQGMRLMGKPATIAIGACLLGYIIYIAIRFIQDV